MKNPNLTNTFEKISALLHRKIASSVQRQQLKTKSLGLVTVSRVKIARDLSTAKVFVLALDQNNSSPAILDALNNVANNIRYEIAQHSSLRRIPRIFFVFDTQEQMAGIVDRILDKELREKELSY